MARTIIRVPFTASVDNTYNVVVSVLQSNGFKEKFL